MNENKIKFWGDVDLANQTLQGISTQFEKLWVGGEYRMRPSDVERLTKYIKEIKESQKKVCSVLSSFEKLNEPFNKNEK